MFRTTAILTAAALMLAAPLAAAQDGNLSRTFLDNGGIDWDKPHSAGDFGGVGYYDPADINNLCLVVLYGVPFNVGFYYETARAGWNAVNEKVVETTGLESLGQYPVPCIFDPLGPNDQFIGSTDFNMWLAPGGRVHQSALVCSALVVGNCLVDSDTVIWSMYDCNEVTGIEFAIGAFFGVPAPNDLMSSAVTDGCDDNGYNFTQYLDPLNSLLSSFPDPHVDQVIAATDATSYVVSCFTFTYDRQVIGGSSTETSETHDWFLVKSASDATTAWVPATVFHLSGNANNLALQGFFDLTNDNGLPSGFADCSEEPVCDDDPLTSIPECKKEATDALVPVDV